MSANRGQPSRSNPPPPPYEDHGGHSRGPYSSKIVVRTPSHQAHQTIPKSAEVGAMVLAGEGAAKKSNKNRHKEQVDEFNRQHTCTSNARKQHHHSNSNGHAGVSSHRCSFQPNGSSSDHDHDHFVKSLAAPKSILGPFSIEPLAFFAILALYVEFPAIQDLIYTKICLEVVGRHSNLTSIEPIGNQAAFLNESANVNNENNRNNNANFALTFDTHGNQSLPASGRIQQASTPGTAIQTPIIPSSNLNSDHHDFRQHHLLCNRLNKTAVPKAVRQEILDIDSLFWLKYQILICLLSALASPYWGGLSDKIGRLIPLNAPIVASVIHNSISLTFGLLISMDSHSSFHINWLFLGAVIVGLSGGQPVLIMNLFSFISDNTTSEERSKRVTILESVIFIAHSVGFFLSRMIMLLGLAPPDMPWLNRHFIAFATCVVLNLICLPYAAAKLRHHKFHRFLNNYERERQEAAIMGSDSSLGSASLGAPGKRAGELGSAGCHFSAGERLRELTSSTPDDPDGPIARSDKANWTFWDTLVTFRYYKETFEIATKKRDTRSTILLLLLSGFISAFSLAALMSLFFVYVKMDPFNWTTSQYSSWNSISAITRGAALVCLTLMMKFAPFWNVPDSIVSAVGFLGKGVGLLMIGLAHSPALINWSLVAFTFSEYSMPPIRSLLSKLVVREELCKVYSCLGALQSLCFILGNIAFYVAFTSYTQQDFFRIAFLVVAGIEFCAVIVMLMIYTSRRRDPAIVSPT